jgi:hypothetical protein
MKFLTYIFILLAFSSFSQIHILNENFELGIPTTWRTAKLDNFTMNPQVSEYSDAWISVLNPDDLTDTIASSSSYFTTPGRANRWLISPQLNLGSYGNYIAWSAKSFDASFPESYRVLISRSNDSIHNFKDTLLFIVDENYEWVNYEINLSELNYNNQQIYVAFVLNTFDGFKFGLDDVAVRVDDPVSVKKIQNQYVFISPNPFQEKITISNYKNVEEIKISDLNGKKIFSQYNPNQILDLSNLENGVYFLELLDKNGVISTEKIVKN